MRWAYSGSLQAFRIRVGFVVASVGCSNLMVLTSPRKEESRDNRSEGKRYKESTTIGDNRREEC